MNSYIYIPKNASIVGPVNQSVRLMPFTRMTKFRKNGNILFEKIMRDLVLRLERNIINTGHGLTTPKLAAGFPSS